MSYCFYNWLSRLVEGEDGEFLIEVPMKKGRKKIPEYYGFTSGRHAGSFFLKIGAAFFCLFHIIHMGLVLVKHIYSIQVRYDYFNFLFFFSLKSLTITVDKPKA